MNWTKRMVNRSTNWNYPIKLERITINTRTSLSQQIWRRRMNFLKGKIFSLILRCRNVTNTSILYNVTNVVIMDTCQQIVIKSRFVNFVQWIILFLNAPTDNNCLNASIVLIKMLKGVQIIILDTWLRLMYANCHGNQLQLIILLNHWKIIAIKYLHIYVFAFGEESTNTVLKNSKKQLLNHLNRKLFNRWFLKIFLSTLNLPFNLHQANNEWIITAKILLSARHYFIWDEQFSNYIKGLYKINGTLYYGYKWSKFH